MSQANALQQWVARLLAATMVVVSILSASAQAAMIPTQKMLSDADRESTRAQVLAVLDPVSYTHLTLPTISSV